MKIAKADDKYSKEVDAKFQQINDKLAEANALIPSKIVNIRSRLQSEKLLASFVAEGDLHCDVKRFEVKKWLEYYICLLNKQITHLCE